MTKIKKIGLGIISAFQFITVVNPVRVSQYTQNPVESVRAQYQIVAENRLPATWLLTHDAIRDPGVERTVKTLDKKQELGVFLEVTPKLAKEAGVAYHETGFWYHANSVFLSAYTQAERMLLIDTLFKKFKEVFGEYPTSAGSWWTDGFSLTYIHDKYGVTANLGVADQKDTDGYTIWGQYWSIPFYPSKYHPAIPAANLDVKLDLVNLQWAARDPLNGYQSSLYSTQDYPITTEELDVSYFEKLVRLFAGRGENEFGQITVGLEGDLPPDLYRGEFSKQMRVVGKLAGDGYRVTTMRDFSQWYREKFPELSPKHVIKTKDLLGSGREVVWEQGPEGRVGAVDGEVFDRRVYSADLIDSYFASPNHEVQLWIEVPDEDLKVGRDGVFLNDYSVEAMHFFRQKKFPFYLLTGRGWEYFRKVNYQVPQGELYALGFLAKQPRGKVLVYDNECLQCTWQTKYKHPALANRRSYIAKYGRHPIVYNKSVFLAQNQEEAKEEFAKTRARYIYLVKFEGYLEKLAFSPGDYGVEKIFENATAQIWKKVN